jgi:hypothetical protein
MKTECKNQFTVECIPHGLLGIVSQASLGLILFEEHRQRVDGCQKATIKPRIKEERWFQRRSMRRITQNGKK